MIKLLGKNLERLRKCLLVGVVLIGLGLNSKHELYSKDWGVQLRRVGLPGRMHAGEVAGGTAQLDDSIGETVSVQTGS